MAIIIIYNTSFFLNEGKEAEGWKHNNGGQWIGEGGEKITLATMGPKGSTMEGTNQFDYDGHTTGEGTQPSTVFLPSFLPSLPRMGHTRPLRQTFFGEATDVRAR